MGVPPRSRTRLGARRGDGRARVAGHPGYARPRVTLTRSLTMMQIVHHSDANMDATEDAMKAITLRNLPDAVAHLIRHRAASEGISLNRAVIEVLEEQLGLGRKPFEPRHHDLDDLAGSWSEEEARAFDDALVAQRAIDPQLWK
jgi:hypothetical protein